MTTTTKSMSAQNGELSWCQILTTRNSLSGVEPAEMSWWIALAYCSALLHACLHQKGFGPSHEIADQVSSTDLRTFLLHGGPLEDRTILV